MARIPPNVQKAIVTLRNMEADLVRIIQLDSATLVVVPGAVPSPEEIALAATDTSGFPKPVVRKGLQWPAQIYQAWREAWEILMAYTGWWGQRRAWPLGDGTRALVDPHEAMKLPTVGGALAKLSGVLILVETPTWKPDLKLSAFIAPAVLATGAFLVARRLAPVR